jgi:hypothetical protein
MQAYHISHWDELYEVDSHGRATTADSGPIDPGSLRRTELEYIRLRPHYPAMGPHNRKLIQLSRLAGLRPLEVIGLFDKLLQIAASQRCEPHFNFRGWMLGLDDRQPLSTDGIADALWLEPDDVARPMAVLTDALVGWVELIEFDPAAPAAGPVRTNPGGSAKVAEAPHSLLEPETGTGIKSGSGNGNRTGEPGFHRPASPLAAGDGAERAPGDEGDGKLVFVLKLAHLLDRRPGRNDAQRSKDMADLVHLDRFIAAMEPAVQDAMRANACKLLAEKVADDAVRNPIAAFISDWRGPGGEYEFRPSRRRGRR